METETRTQQTNLHPDGKPLTIAEIVRYAEIEHPDYIRAQHLANAAPALLAALADLLDDTEYEYEQDLDNIGGGVMGNTIAVRKAADAAIDAARGTDA